MTNTEGEQEALRRWRQLPLDQRSRFEDAEAYAVRLDLELDFPTVISRHRLIAAWLMRDLIATRAARTEATKAA
jgi:hypothetical protein